MCVHQSWLLIVPIYPVTRHCHVTVSACEAGTYSAAGTVPCSPCPAGEWSGSGALSCTACTDGLTTINTGATSIAECVGEYWH